MNILKTMVLAAVPLLASQPSYSQKPGLGSLFPDFGGSDVIHAVYFSHDAKNPDGHVFVCGQDRPFVASVDGGKELIAWLADSNNLTKREAVYFTKKAPASQGNSSVSVTFGLSEKLEPFAKTGIETSGPRNSSLGEAQEAKQSAAILDKECKQDMVQLGHTGVGKAWTKIGVETWARAVIETITYDRLEPHLGAGPFSRFGAALKTLGAE